MVTISDRLPPPPPPNQSGHKVTLHYTMGQVIRAQISYRSQIYSFLLYVKVHQNVRLEYAWSSCDI
jgi:hypothetical protein